jgi:choline dehydrogenase
MRKSWDYVIVGGGSAGATIAARLSERADAQILLVEAGGRDWSPQIHIPGLLEGALTSKTLNWAYQGEPDTTLNGRRLTWAAGRVLGGSSSINGMVYGRGLPADYARWVAGGAVGWGWDNLLPYFKKLERWTGAPHPSRGTDGPLEVRRFEDTDSACASVIAALIRLGVPEVADYSTGITEGVGLTQATQKGGWRHSAAAAYLRPARGRANLTLLTHTLAQKLLFEGDRCIGVRLHRRGKSFDVVAEREVIVSAGAIASPKLLLLSGVGPADELMMLGIRPVRDLPGVGRHLNDHVNIKLSAFVNSPTYNTQRRGLKALGHGLRLLTQGRGPASSPANHAQAFVRTDPSQPSADLQLQVMAFGFGTEAEMAQNGLTVVVSPCHPEARGQITLTSSDPAAPPRIAMTMLAHEADIQRLLRGCRLAQEALELGPIQRFGGRLYAPTATGALSDQDWIKFFRETAWLNWHPTSTCRMGTGTLDVVDLELKVHGVAGLSVVDASVMPTVTSANTNIPVIAIAERAAELIAARSG